MQSLKKQMARRKAQGTDDELKRSKPVLRDKPTTKSAAISASIPAAMPPPIPIVTDLPSPVKEVEGVSQVPVGTPTKQNGSSRLSRLNSKRIGTKSASPGSKSRSNKPDDEVRKKLTSFFFWEKDKDRGKVNDNETPSKYSAPIPVSPRDLGPGNKDTAQSLKGNIDRTSIEKKPKRQISHQHAQSSSHVSAPKSPEHRDSHDARDIRPRSESTDSNSKRRSWTAHFIPAPSSSTAASIGTTNSAGSIDARASRSGSGGASASASHGLTHGAGGSRQRLARLKQKAASIGRSSRDSVDSTQSSQNSLSLAGVPFPIIRTHSGSTDIPKRNFENRPRRRTEGENSINANHDFANTTSNSTFATVNPERGSSNSPALVVTDVAEDPMPLRPNGCSPEEYAKILHQYAPPGTARWRKVCGLLAVESGEDSVKCILAYLQGAFSFKKEPIDMSLRKFLLFITLPTETQQIERVLQAFSMLYVEQNPGVFADAEQVFFVVFSLVILHTDTFNRNVKHKMQKSDYVHSTYTEGISTEILEYLYDNITCLQFQKEENLYSNAPSIFGYSYSGHNHPHTPLASPELTQDSLSGGSSPAFTFSNQMSSSSWAEDSPSEGISSRRSTISMNLPWNSNGSSTSSGNDTYSLLLGNRLDILRPNIDIPGDDDDNGANKFGQGSSTTDIGSKGDECKYDPLSLFKNFTDYEQFIEKHFSSEIDYSLQLVSPRSRPEAYIDHFIDDASQVSAAELIQKSRPGVVDVKVIKYGILMRPEQKRMLYPAKAGWREWGAILTESQLYLFKNSAWIKSAVDSRRLQNVLTPPPDVLATATVFSTNELMALSPGVDQTSTPNQFMILCQGSTTPMWLVAPNEQEYMDWIRILDITATCSTFRIPLPTQSPSTPAGSMSPSSPVNSGSFQPPQGHPNMPMATGPDTGHVKSPSMTSLTSQTSSLASGISQHGGLYSRGKMLALQLHEVNQRLASIDVQMQQHRNELLHLKLLAPIQQRTRESIMYSAGQAASKLESCRLDRRKYRCYKQLIDFDIQLLDMIHQQTKIKALMSASGEVTPISSTSSNSRVPLMYSDVSVLSPVSAPPDLSVPSLPLAPSVPSVPSVPEILIDPSDPSAPEPLGES